MHMTPRLNPMPLPLSFATRQPSRHLFQQRAGHLPRQSARRFARFAAGFGWQTTRWPELRRRQRERVARRRLWDRHAGRLCDRLSGLHELRQLRKGREKRERMEGKVEK